MCKKIQKRHSDVFLSDFESLPAISTYQLTPRGEKFITLSIDDFYATIPRGHAITPEYLKYRHIYVTNSDEAEPVNWSLFKCLFAEIAILKASFILFKGNWYEIASNYLAGLRKFIADHEIDNMDDILPKWNGTDSEGEYNISASKFIKGQCWDKELYRAPDFDYGIEFCDILTEDFIIHVKKYKSSALNSHLLLQTAVSAQLLDSDPGLKKWIKKKSLSLFKGNIFLKRNNEFKNPNVGYLIALMKNDARNLADSLPFFSLISFNIIIKRISQQGIEVRIGSV